MLGVGPDPLPTFAATRGLRSVPYLILSDTGMTETCALHLSFIVEGHHVPGQLLTHVPLAKAGTHTQQIMGYNESQCRGIIYHPNTSLGNTGLKVLELAERRRDQQRCEMNEADVGSPSSLSDTTQSPRRTSVNTIGIGNITAAKRRRSTQTGDLIDDGIEAELDRARSRIQGNTLQDAGLQSNDLWRAALRLLAIGRHVPPQSDRKVQPTPSAPAAPTALAVPKAKAPIVKTLTIPGVSKPKALKLLTPLTTEKDPNQPINPWKTNPWNKNPWNTDLGKKGDGIPPTPNVIPPTPPTPPSPKTETETETKSPKAVAEKTQLLRTEKVYRAKLPRGFSDAIWAKILGHLVGADGILSDDQQLSVLRYAIDRNTLSKEREALGLTFATQIWRILEATGCLTYDMDI